MPYELQSRLPMSQRLDEINVMINHIQSIGSDTSDKLAAVNVSKANVVLMIYNLIESTVFNSFNELYSDMSMHSDYVKTNENVLELWVDSSMYSSFGRDKSFKDHLTAFKNLLNKYKDNKIDMNYHRPTSGNLDFEKIINDCNKHGIKVNLDSLDCKSCLHSIQSVKSIRNNLSHGEQSFQEKGRDLTIDDLVTY